MENILFVGRVDLTEKFPKFVYSGSGIIANVSGNKIAVKFRTEQTNEIYYVAVIDQTSTVRFSVKKDENLESLEFALAQELQPNENGYHRVEIYRDNECTEGISVFCGFSHGNFQSTPPPTPRLRNIEIVGDSISAGYGILGEEFHNYNEDTQTEAENYCGYTPNCSSWYSTYAAVAGRSFDAQVVTIARSGWGVTRGYGGNEKDLMSLIYGNTLGPWEEDKKWVKNVVVNDAVVVNLGTNDWSVGDPGQKFEEYYVSFLKTIRRYNPTSYIFLTYGPMLDGDSFDECRVRLERILKEFAAIDNGNECKISLFDFGHDPGRTDDSGNIPTGCDWHPNVEINLEMAEILKRKLSETLNW